MIDLEDRRTLAQDIGTAHRAGARLHLACETAGISVRTLQRWQALTRYLNDGNIPIDNNWIENRIRPIAIGRANWLFVGSQRAGERAAAVMTLVNSAKLNGIDPHAYLADVLDRLPTTKARDIEQLLPHRWAAQRGWHDG